MLKIKKREIKTSEAKVTSYKETYVSDWPEKLGRTITKALI